MTASLFYELKPATSGFNTDVVASLCPVCQQTNECAVANHVKPSGCWCISSGVPAELRQQLQVIDPDRCLCNACLVFFKQHGHLPDLSVNK